jgi:peroxiredoxin
VTGIDYRTAGPEQGAIFPDFELPNTDGEAVRLHEWRDSRRALMVFFRSASW